MTCLLKDQLEGIIQFVGVFRDWGVDIETVEWSDYKESVRRLRASLSGARTVLIPLPIYNRVFA